MPFQAFNFFGGETQEKKEIRWWHSTVLLVPLQIICLGQTRLKDEVKGLPTRRWAPDGPFYSVFFWLGGWAPTLF